MADITQFLFEIGFSIGVFLHQLQSDKQSLIHILPAELIENIIGKTEEETEYRSKSQIMDFLRSSEYFIFKIKNEYLLKRRCIDADKFRFYCINLKDFIQNYDGWHRFQYSETLLFRICRKFIKIYFNGKLIARMNRFFTIRKLNRFEPSCLAGRLMQRMMLS